MNVANSLLDSSFMLSSEEMYKREAAKGNEEGDEVFSSSEEVALPKETYWFHDKYKPRKPQFFNRVR